MNSSREVVDDVRREVALHFQIKETYATGGGLAFVVEPPTDLESSFEELRHRLRPKGMVASLDDKQGRFTVFVVSLPRRKTRPASMNQLMLLLTFVTTVVSGSLLWASFSGEGTILSADNLLWGALTFAMPLLLILGTHELSHYLMSRRYGLSVSLPFFIPSIPPIGTFGAFISIREPLPSRKALVDIGLAGPFGGFLVAIPVLIIGYSLSTGETSGLWQEGLVTFFGMPLIMQAMMALFPNGGDLLMHPTMFAGWLGLFITGINLLPAGQLDGGHVSRAVLGNRAVIVAYLVLGILMLLSTIYIGWLIFGLLILILGVSHPPPLNDITPLDGRRYVAAALGLVLLVTCFIPIPMESRVNQAALELDGTEGTNITMEPGGWSYLNISLENTGNIPLDASIGMQGLPEGWNYSIELVGSGQNVTDGILAFTLAVGEAAQLRLAVLAPMGTTGGNYTANITASAGSAEDSLALSLILA
ncbi:MAG: site-2 protease family protein [Candidatus Methanomethylophilaceae archaeon]